MIPRITAGGCSFKAAARYYLHDKGADTSDRVAWTRTENLLTQDPERAWRCMAFTAMEAARLKEASGQKRTGRKLTKPVFAYSLSWHPEQTPDRRQMLQAAHLSLRALGMEEHQIMIVAHRDEPQFHLHILVNRVHPLTGLACDLKNSKRTLSDFAREYEREQGKVYCGQREQNHQKRQRGERTRYRDQNIVEAWRQSDDGRSFVTALKEKGYQLAQGVKRLVVVDPYGQTTNPLRHLEGVRTKDLDARLRNVDRSSLPDATVLSRAVQQENRRRYQDSLKFDHWSAREKNRMQDRHLSERSKVSSQHHERIEGENDKITKFYGLTEQQRKIEILRARTRNPSLWRRLVGLDRKDQTQLGQAEAGYASARRRYEERIGQLMAERDAAMNKLSSQQDAQKRSTEERIEAKRPFNYADHTERERLKPHLRGRERKRDDPELEL